MIFGVDHIVNLHVSLSVADNLVNRSTDMVKLSIVPAKVYIWVRITKKLSVAACYKYSNNQKNWVFIFRNLNIN